MSRQAVPLTSESRGDLSDNDDVAYEDDSAKGYSPASSSDDPTWIPPSTVPTTFPGSSAGPSGTATSSSISTLSQGKTAAPPDISSLDLGGSSTRGAKLKQAADHNQQKTPDLPAAQVPFIFSSPDALKSAVKDALGEEREALVADLADRVAKLVMDRLQAVLENVEGDGVTGGDMVTPKKQRAKVDATDAMYSSIRERVKNRYSVGSAVTTPAGSHGTIKKFTDKHAIVYFATDAANKHIRFDNEDIFKLD
jgi:preprotein translocase subunit YajC